MQYKRTECHVWKWLSTSFSFISNLIRQYCPCLLISQSTVYSSFIGSIFILTPLVLLFARSCLVEFAPCHCSVYLVDLLEWGCSLNAGCDCVCKFSWHCLFSSCESWVQLSGFDSRLDLVCGCGNILFFTLTQFFFLNRVQPQILLYDVNWVPNVRDFSIAIK